MRYLALATDYDGTIARQGQVSAETQAALERVRASGRRLIMVTGRELPDLERVFPRLELFDRIVAENGALVYRPETKQTTTLSERPPQRFVDELRARSVEPMSVGEVIVATWTPHESTVIEVIKDLGLELQVIFNKGAVMILPAGVNKAVGLAAALDELELSPHNVVGVGDAENDHAFLSVCEFSVAVANSVPFIAERADFVTQASHGEGVQELIEALVSDDLATLGGDIRRHDILLGEAGREPVTVPPARETVLVAGSSGSGKSTLVTGFLERLTDASYQFCVIDPEGDYENYDGAVLFGTAKRAPSVDEIGAFFTSPTANAIVNLLDVPLEDRPAFFHSLLPRLLEERARTGRPHWIVVDEAHHMLPAVAEGERPTYPVNLDGVMMITVHPDRLPPEILARVGTVIATGDVRPVIAAVARAAHLDAPESPEEGPVLWRVGAGEEPQAFTIAPSRFDHQRHVRKYAEGDLGEDRSFYFRGPRDALNLRAQNLELFLQIGDGVDDETWLHHLRNGDFSNWFEDKVKDPDLADGARAIEADGSLDVKEARARIRELVESRYTAPA